MAYEVAVGRGHRRLDVVPDVRVIAEDPEYERLSERGVEFTQEPTTAGGVTMAVFDDTCGNFIQIAQQ